MLLKVIEEIKIKNDIVTIADMQGKERLSAESILIEILQLILSDLKSCIYKDKDWESYIIRKSKIKFYKFKSIYYGFTNKKFWDNIIEEKDKLNNEIEKISSRLNIIKNTQDESITKRINENKKSKSKKIDFNSIFTFGAEKSYIKRINLGVEYNFNFHEEDVRHVISEISDKFCKKDELDELKRNLVYCFEKIYKLYNKSTYLILDDFYQTPLELQPYIFQFLHDLSKKSSNTSFSFKSCLVPNRFKLNEDSNKVLSHKDDFSTINLDRDFFDLDSNKELLFKILCGIDSTLKLNTIKINKLFNDKNVINDCVRASGALPRYFLDVFSHMIKYSRSENQSKIHKMVLSQVIREIKKSKDSLIAEEAYLPDDKIRELCKLIENEIVYGLKINVILYPIESFNINEETLNCLINLGYFHRIKESFLLGKNTYVALFVDMIFTHTKSDKLPKNFKDVKFWENPNQKLFKCPIWGFNDIYLADAV